MWTAIGEALPLGIGLALSPFAIVTGIVLLLGAGGRLKALLFGIGWFLAIGVLTAVGLLVVEMAADVSGEGAPEGGVDIAQLLFGLLFLVLAAVTWRKNSRGAQTADGDVSESPGLLGRLEGISALGALGIGLAQGFMVIKNLPLALGAGAVFGEAGLVGARAITALLVFALVASLGVLVPLAVAAVGGHRLDPALQRTRDWLEANMTTITLTVLLVLGALFLGQGLGVLD